MATAECQGTGGKRSGKITDFSWIADSSWIANGATTRNVRFVTNPYMASRTLSGSLPCVFSVAQASSPVLRMHGCLTAQAHIIRRSENEFARIGCGRGGLTGLGIGCTQAFPRLRTQSLGNIRFTALGTERSRLAHLLQLLPGFH